jgi:hypothetical protein
MIMTLIALFLLALGFSCGVLWADLHHDKHDRLPDETVQKLRSGRWS